MGTTSHSKRCPKCGGPIPAEAPQGLCPKCLLLQASSPTEAGRGAPSKSAPPTHEELAAAFPQLEILELIGQGGMGFVFKARQPKLERLVALKILPQSLAADPAFAERFTREGRMLARLNHPNIVTVHDFGQAGGFFYLLMEFVDGVNLRQAMKVGRFTPAQALSVVPKICEALQFAHNEGILHRDIKPENILLDAKGRVKIADFGIAKLTGEAHRGPFANGQRHGARHAAVHGARATGTSGDVDQRADIYSLGVVFYEMLTGELPLGRFQPPSEKVPLDARLDEVVLHALEKEPARRYQQAGEVKTAVETIAATPARPSAPAGAEPLVAAGAAPAPRPGRFWRWFAVGVLALIAIPLAIVFTVFAIPNFLKARSQAPQPDAVAVTETNTVPSLAFGPVIERTINRAKTGTNFLLDFKTGELRTPPSEGAGGGPNIFRWAQREGLDAGVGVLQPDQDVLTGFDMVVLPAPAQCWQELMPAEAAARLATQPASSFVTMLYANGSPRETCVFRTRDGRIGILQLTGYESSPPGVRIRYKLTDSAPVMAQTPSNVATESWTPTLWPGEKPDPQKILEEAKKLTATAHFEEALQRYVWHFNHAQEFGDSWQNAVRLTSALADWAELGRRYPKARQALVEIRDNDTREITQGRGYAEMFKEVQAINHELGDEDATYALFKTVREQRSQAGGPMLLLSAGFAGGQGRVSMVPQALGRSRRSGSILSAQGLDRDRDNQKRMTETMRSTAQQMADMNQKHGRTNSWSPPDTSAMMKNSAEDSFVGQTRQLIEILVGAGHKAEAERIRVLAVGVLDDARLKSAVSDAEQRIQQRSLQSANH